MRRPNQIAADEAVMENITWDERYDIKIETIDRQHRRLVDLMNHLIEIQDQTTSVAEVAEILGALTNYVGEHFDTEEQMMIDYGYPELEAHREEHQAFVTRTAYFIATYRESGPSLKKDILSFLKDWLMKHIRQTDAAFGTFLKNSGLV